MLTNNRLSTGAGCINDINCPPREIVCSKGRKADRAVVIGLTAAGILSGLHSCDLPSVSIEAAKDRALVRFLLKISLVRRCFNYLFTTAKQEVRNYLFSVKSPLSPRLSEFLKQLLSRSESGQSNIAAMKYILGYASD